MAMNDGLKSWNDGLKSWNAHELWCKKLEWPITMVLKVVQRSRTMV